jgi:putative transposase
MWSMVKRSLGNFTVRTIDQVAATVKHLLKRIQYSPDLINSYIAETGLDLSFAASRGFGSTGRKSNGYR